MTQKKEIGLPGELFIFMMLIAAVLEREYSWTIAELQRFMGWAQSSQAEFTALLVDLDLEDKSQATPEKIKTALEAAMSAD